jgi:hypothetical protein
MGVLEQLAAQAQVTGDVGEKLDTALEAAQAEVYRLQGGSLWLKAGTKGVGGLADHIRQDFEAGKFEGLDAKAIHDLLLDWNRKAVECMVNLADQKKSEGLAAEGKILGLREAMKLVQQSHDVASKRASMIVAQEPPVDEQAARGERRARMPGEHPGPSPLDARRQEAAKAEVAESEKPKRGRKKKATG